MQRTRNHSAGEREFTAPGEDAYGPTYESGEAPAPREDMPLVEPGTVIKHYEIIRKLGAGGMGMVFLARDTRLGRLVAIKFLLAHSGPAAARFLVEARTTARCRHENIVVIYDVDELDGYPYMVLEYIEGKPLREVMVERAANDQAASPHFALELALPITRALVCAHEMEIVHRDLKPENILLSESGVLRVLDFGIAKQMTPELAAVTGLEPTLPHTSVQITQDGALAGTFPYMSPEQWLMEPLDGRTDLWALGIILFELLAGEHPVAPITLAALADVADVSIPMPSLRERRPDLGPIAEIVDRCLKKQKEERFGSARELLAALEALLSSTRAQEQTGAGEESPFAGLAAFQEEDASRFFGRESDVAAVVGMLRQHELITIAGPSGAGKSSFVRAGVIPALKLSGRSLEAIVVRPGLRPLAALADVLEDLTNTGDGAEVPAPESLARSLGSSPGLLGARLRARCRARGADHRILLFVDQLEELYTLGTSPAERARFFSILAGVADDASSPLRVLLTVRADFLDRISEDRRFLTAVTRGLVFLPPIGPESLRAALEKPLAALQYRFEDEDLVTEMIDGLAGAKSPLPLLQFTATKLWEGRDRERRLLTREGYHALGGVAGALSTHADAVLAGLSPREQLLARAIFLRLVTPERTRAIVPWDELCALDPDREAVARVAERLANARILAIEAAADGEDKLVELLHESLIERWSKLDQWLDEVQHDAQFLVELRNAAQQWEKNGEAEDFLWRDRAADTAGSWLEEHRTGLSGEGAAPLGEREARYLAAVVHLSQRTRRLRRTLFIAASALSGAIAVVVVVLALRARAQASRADAARAKAEAAEAEARDKAIEALDARLLAGARELQAARDFASSGKLLLDVQKPGEARGYFSLVNTALRGNNFLFTRGMSDQQWFYLTYPQSVLRGHARALTAAAWSHDGKRVLSASLDETARIWLADGTGDPIVLRPSSAPVSHAAWSPDDQSVLTVSQDGSVMIWHADGRGPKRKLSSGSAPPTAAAWSPRGDAIAVASGDRTIHVWDVDGDEHRAMSGHEGAITELAFMPDGTGLLSSSMDGTARLWPSQASRAPRVFRGHRGPVRFVAPSPDGSRFVTTSADGTARIFGVADEGATVVLQGHTASVDAAAWSPDGSRVATGSADKTVRVWRADGRGAPTVLVGAHAACTAVAFRPDGRHVAAASQEDAFLWPAAGGEGLFLPMGSAPVLSATFSPDGGRVLVAASRGDEKKPIDPIASIFRIDDLSMPARDRSGHYHAAAIDAKGEFIVAAYDDRTVKRFRAYGSGEPRVVAEHASWIASAAWSPDGEQIVTASFDGTAKIVHVDGSAPPVVLKWHTGPVRAAAWSPDMRHVATVSDDGRLIIHSRDGREATRHAGHKDGLISATYSPDGKRIVTTSRDHTARVWTLDDSKEPLSLVGHVATLSAAAWSPDGKRIATAGDDGTARVWDAETGAELAVLEHDDPVTRVSFTPDGARIATATSRVVSLFRSDGEGEPLRFSLSVAVLSFSFQNEGRELVVVGPSRRIRTLVLDVELSKQRLRASNTECLPIAMRSTHLGEEEEIARERFEACERQYGRTPRTMEDGAP